MNTSSPTSDARLLQRLCRHGIGWVLLGFTALSVQGATYTVSRARIAGGGGTGAGGPFSLHATVGQADAHAARTSADVTVSGGFWIPWNVSPANRPPVAGGDWIVRHDNALYAKVPIATLLGNDQDPDGDPLSLTGVGGALPAGASVLLLGPWVIYTAPAMGAGDGSFTYTLSDGDGGHRVTGLVTVSVQPAPKPGGPPNPVSMSASGGNISVSFLGVPGHRYRVLYTTDLTPPHTWRDFAPPAIYTAPESGVAGLFQHLDSQPPDAQRFYRAVSDQ